ncbi:MAG: holo-ACP synthase [Candidatus Zixiibacteriota bacterium]
MLVGIGIDRLEIERMRGAWQRHGERLRRRVFTDGEWTYCLSRPDPAPSLAARFAAKEAVMKSLRRGWGGGVHFRDVEITRTPAGAPEIRLHRNAHALANTIGAARILVSLTHDRTHAMAVVMAETGD